jgi:hypothetical protein
MTGSLEAIKFTTTWFKGPVAMSAYAISSRNFGSILSLQSQTRSSAQRRRSLTRTSCLAAMGQPTERWCGKWKLANGMTRFQNGGSCHVNRIRLRPARNRAHQQLRIPAKNPISSAKCNAFGS